MVHFQPFASVHKRTEATVKAKDGKQFKVTNHVLIDGFGSMSLPKTMVDFFKEAGAMVLMFRPKTSPWTLRRRRLRRLHRKIVVVDQTIAFVGGINIIDVSCNLKSFLQMPIFCPD